MEKIDKILVLSPHADDGELGCGATVSKFIEKGVDVHFLVLSLRRKTVPVDFPEDKLIKECTDAMSALGLNKNNWHIRDYEHRIFPELRQELLDQLIKIRKDIEPDLVFAPSFDDMHQDHGIIANESFRAFKNNKILSYELPWNRIVTHTNFYTSVDKHHLEKKAKALSFYESQKPGRPFFDKDYIFSLAKIRGAEIKKEYAESFEVMRWIYE